MDCSHFNGYGISTGDFKKELTLSNLYDLLINYKERSSYALELIELINSSQNEIDMFYEGQMGLPDDEIEILHVDDEDILMHILEQKNSFNKTGILAIIQQIIFEVTGVLLNVFYYDFAVDQEEEVYLYVDLDYPWNTPKSNCISKEEYDEIFSEFTTALGEEVAPEYIYFTF